MQKPSSSGNRAAGSRPATRKPQKDSRRFLGMPLALAILLGIVALGVVGTGVALGVTMAVGALRGASAQQGVDRQNVDEALKKAAYYTGKGEYQEALSVLNTLSIDNPRVKAALDDVLAKKQAAEQAARQSELAALKAQQDQLKAGLAQLGDTLKNQKQQIVVQQPVKAPPEDASAKEKELAKKVQDLMQKGAAAFNAGRYAEARKSFEQASGLAPDNSDALAYAGLSYLRDNPDDPANVQKAVDLSNAAISRNPDNWIAHRTLGEVYDSRKLADQAMKEYATAARLNASDADTWYALGKLQYRAKLFADAQTSFQKCVSLRPDFTSAHFNRGMSLVQLGDKARALDAFKVSVATKKDFADGWYMVGYLQRDKGDTAAALDAFKAAAQYAPTNAGYLRELGSAYMARSDYASAEGALSKSLALDPDNAVTNYNMASAKIKLGKPREALPFAQKAVDKDGGSASSTYVLGLASEKLGNTDDAVRYYSIAVQKNPKFAPALINLGSIFDSQGLPDKALPLLLAAQDVDPESYELQNNLGNVYLHQQQYDQSVTHLSKALGIQPSSTVTEYNLGLAYSETGQISQAKSSFVDVITRDPSNMDAYIKLARIFIKEGNSKDAKDLLTRLLAKSPKQAVRDEAQKLLDQL